MAWARTDDLDGGSAAEPVTFGFEGKAYTIDLSTANKAKMQKALQPFLTVAAVYGDLPTAANGTPTPTGSNGTSAMPEGSWPDNPTPRRRAAAKAPAVKTASSRKASTQPTAAPRRGRGKKSTAVPQATVRQWANENGFNVTPKGRIPNQVVEAYSAAHA